MHMFIRKGFTTRIHNDQDILYLFQNEVFPTVYRLDLIPFRGFHKNVETLTTLEIT